MEARGPSIYGYLTFFVVRSYTIRAVSFKILICLKLFKLFNQQPSDQMSSSFWQAHNNNPGSAVDTLFGY